MPKYADSTTLERALTLVKGYIDELVRKKMDSFTLGDGLSLENSILSITLDTGLFKVVESLPSTPATSDVNKIFLVLDTSNPETGNVYIEYLWTGSEWEEIGRRQVEIDLTPYLKKTELTATVSTTSFALQKSGEQFGAIVFGSNDFQCAAGTTSLNVSLRDILASAVTSGMYKIAMDKKGRITGYTAVQLSDLTGLGLAKQTDLDTTNTNLANEITARQTAVSTLTQTVQANKDAADAADTALDTRLKSVESDVTALKTAGTTLQTNLEAEVTRAKAAEQANADAIAAETTAREEANTTLKVDIATVAANLLTETSDRKAADSTLQENITAEVTARETAVSAEATARETADTALDTRVKVLEEALADRTIITEAEVTALYNEVYSS